MLHRKCSRLQTKLQGQKRLLYLDSWQDPEVCIEIKFFLLFNLQSETQHSISECAHVNARLLLDLHSGCARI